MTWPVNVTRVGANNRNRRLFINLVEKICSTNVYQTFLLIWLAKICELMSLRSDFLVKVQPGHHGWCSA